MWTWPQLDRMSRVPPMARVLLTPYINALLIQTGQHQLRFSRFSQRTYIRLAPSEVYICCPSSSRRIYRK